MTNFAKIFPYGVDVYNVWYENPPTLEELKKLSVELFEGFTQEVSDAIVENHYSVMDYLYREDPVTFVLLDNEIYGMSIKGEWTLYARNILPKGWNVT